MSQDTDWLVVGISGITCGGKTTLASALHAEFPGSVLLHQDTYFLPPDDPRHTLVPDLNHLNWEIPSSLDMERMRSDILEIITRPITQMTVPLLIIEGFLIFVDEMISSLCRHKFFFTLTREECWARRSARVYDPPDVPGYFDQVVWPEYARQITIALDLNPDMNLLVSSHDMNKVLNHIKTKVSQDLERRTK